MTIRSISELYKNVSKEKRPALSLGLISSLSLTVLGLGYFFVILVLLLSGQMTLPPAEQIQSFAAIVSIIVAPLIIIFCASIHFLVPENRKIFSLLGIVFSVMFAVFVCINRFVQLSVVRLSILEGNTEGLSRFLPYEPRSAMFALEMIGWGALLGVALFFIAFALKNKGLGKFIKYTLFTYTLLGIVSSIAFIVDSPLSAIGFVAWGLILYVATGLVAISLLKFEKYWT